MISWPHTPTPSLDEDTPSQSTGTLSPCENLHGDEDKDELVSSSKLKLVIPAKCPSDSTSSQPSKKCKSPQDLLKDVADAEQDACLTINAINAKQCTAREETKHRFAHDTAITVEQMCIQAQSEQAAADQAH